MADAWPADLPQCFVRGYSEGMADGLIETSPDIGPPITRRRSSASTRPLSGAMRLTRAQLATLRDFVDETLAGGALPFTFPDPSVTGNTLLVKFQKGNLPNWQEAGPGVYQVSLSLLVLP